MRRLDCAQSLWEDAMKHLLTALLVLIMVRPVFAADAELSISRAGARTVAPGPAEHFTGKVQVEILQAPAAPERTSTGSVHFDAGARTAWHTHPLGQTLIVTAGVGRVQVFGGPVQEIKAGDVVHIPPGVKHWHGAAATSAMTHIAVTEASNGKTADWLEPVSDAQYAASKQDVTGHHRLQRSGPGREPGGSESLPAAGGGREIHA
jgi:4-carboxymuconolactone decarboxylase